jgi:hypothetical protein
VLFALVNALEALRYLLPHVPFPAEIDNFTQKRIALSLHAFGGAMALLTGPLQFLPPFRERSWSRHRVLGGFIAAPYSSAGALRSGSRRMRRLVGSLPPDF